MSNDRLVTASHTPGGSWSMTSVHGGEEVGHLAVLEHHALGQAGRARRVDEVGEVGRVVVDAVAGPAVVAVAAAAGSMTVMLGPAELDGRARRWRAATAMPASSTMNAEALDRVGRVERQVGGAEVERGEHADDHVDAAGHGDADAVAAPDAGAAASRPASPPPRPPARRRSACGRRTTAPARPACGRPGRGTARRSSPCGRGRARSG